MDTTVVAVPRNAGVCVVDNGPQPFARLSQRLFCAFLLCQIEDRSNPPGHFAILILLRRINAMKETPSKSSKWHQRFVSDRLARQDAFYIWPNCCQPFFAHDLSDG